jgi:3-hydroxyisobutyrate dehydrogenase-like beta-hydroxyacid dehydrogenase
MLTDDAAVEGVAFGETGITAGLGKDAIHISMSTISVGLSERLAAAHAKAGQRYVSAPVFGGPEAAVVARLFIASAGPTDALDACMPLFEAMGQKTFRIGNKAPTANMVKLSGNFLIASVIESLGEALALVSKAGVDRHQYVDLLTSSLFALEIYKTYGGLLAMANLLPQASVRFWD